MYTALRLRSYAPIHHSCLLTEMKRVARPRPREQQQIAPYMRGLCCGVQSNASARGQVELSTFRQDCTEIFSPRTPLGLATEEPHADSRMAETSLPQTVGQQPARAGNAARGSPPHVSSQQLMLSLLKPLGQGRENLAPRGAPAGAAGRPAAAVPVPQVDPCLPGPAQLSTNPPKT